MRAQLRPQGVQARRCRYRPRPPTSTSRLQSAVALPARRRRCRARCRRRNHSPLLERRHHSCRRRVRLRVSPSRTESRARGEAGSSSTSGQLGFFAPSRLWGLVSALGFTALGLLLPLLRGQCGQHCHRCRRASPSRGGLAARGVAHRHRARRHQRHGDASCLSPLTVGVAARRSHQAPANSITARALSNLCA